MPHGNRFVRKAISINRAGAPREAVEFQNALRSDFAEEPERPHPSSPGDDRKPRRTNFAQIIRRAVAIAAIGQAWAIERVFDRIGGKVMQPIDETGRCGGPMQHSRLAFTATRAGPEHGVHFIPQA
jgi:hypothetical protein